MNTAALSPMTEDAGLVERVRAGDQRACEALVRKHIGAMMTCEGCDKRVRRETHRQRFCGEKCKKSLHNKRRSRRF